MPVKNGLRKAFVIAGMMFLMVANASVVLGQCIYEPDGPDCPCFNHTGAWDPGATFIQDTAIPTVGTAESCDPPVDDGGKPYYQMVIGCNSQLCAEFVSWALATFGPIYDDREWWCSETVSYWHRETGIPYAGGYRTAWHPNWQNYSVGDLYLWYLTEDPIYGNGGRGRWIDAGYQLDYENFELGVTVPVPGSYVAIASYDVRWDAWFVGDYSHRHSLMIDEMWVHTNSYGEVFRVEVTLLEGNSGEKVTQGARWDDLLELSPQGPDTVIMSQNRKIYGFGVDLDSNGDPIYDPARLHFVNHPSISAGPVLARPVHADDPDWQTYAVRVADLINYAALLRQNQGVGIYSASPIPLIGGLPDGVSESWFFVSSEIDDQVVIEIDFRDVHPLPIRGIILNWEGSFLPRGYSVEYAGADQVYRSATLPDLSNAVIPVQSPEYPIPSWFSGNGSGVPVRYVRLTFPNGVFSEDATLLELRVIFEHGPMQDDPNPEPVQAIRGDNVLVPTLSSWGAVAMLAMLLAVGLRRFRRRS